jgi:exodeoxyribonuclease VII small subunit
VATSGKANGADDGSGEKDGGPAPAAVPAAGQALSYEQARDKLAAVVKRLEAGGLTLEQSLELWERGERLAAVCAEWLDGARARLAAAMAEREEPAAGADDAAETPF